MIDAMPADAARCRMPLIIFRVNGHTTATPRHCRHYFFFSLAGVYFRHAHCCAMPRHAALMLCSALTRLRYAFAMPPLDVTPRFLPELLPRELRHAADAADGTNADAQEVAHAYVRRCFITYALIRCRRMPPVAMPRSLFRRLFFFEFRHFDYHAGVYVFTMPPRHGCLHYAMRFAAITSPLPPSPDDFLPTEFRLSDTTRRYVFATLLALRFFAARCFSLICLSRRFMLLRHFRCHFALRCGRCLLFYFRHYVYDALIRRDAVFAIDTPRRDAAIAHTLITTGRRHAPCCFRGFRDAMLPLLLLRHMPLLITAILLAPLRRT